MKLISLVLITFLSINTLLLGQVGIGTVNPEASAILDVESTTKGFLLPRVSEHTVVANPAIGLMIYDLTDHCINVYLGNDTWKNLCETTPGGGGGTGIITVPPTDPLGEVNISTKICFDVAETNDAPDGCGALQMRTPIEADFTDAGTHTQTLTISSTSAIDNIVVSALDLSGKVILNANPPLVNSLLANESTTATIEYKQDLNTEATGLDHANRLTATIYVNYDEAGVAKQVQISPFVKDCACSQIESTNGEQHMFINDAGELYSGNTPFYWQATVLGHASNSFTEYKQVPIPGNVKIIDVTYGEKAAIALGENGTPYVFGTEDYRAFGNSNSNTQASPTALNGYISGTSVPINEPVIDVAMGFEHSVYLTQSLKLYIAGGPYGAGRSFGSGAANTGFPLAEVSLPSGAGSPIAIYADKNNTWVIDDNGDAYASGRAYFDAFGFNATFFAGASQGQQVFKKLQLGPNPPNAISGGILPSMDFPSRITDISGTTRATILLLENGDIFYAGQNANINTEPKIQVTNTTLKYTSIFGKMTMDGDAVSMGQPVDVHVFSNWENYDGSPNETSSIVYILDDKGDLYAKGEYAGATPLGILGGWGSNNIQATFKKIDLSVMGTEKIVNIKTNYGTTVLVSDAGKLYYTGVSGVISNSSTAIENTFKAADKSPASNTNWVK